MKKGDRVTITITDLTTDGEGIGHADGFALFVKDTVAGDTVECTVMKLKKIRKGSEGDASKEPAGDPDGSPA